MNNIGSTHGLGPEIGESGQLPYSPRITIDGELGESTVGDTGCKRRAALTDGTTRGLIVDCIWV
jgi:hypothetical protein